MTGTRAKIPPPRRQRADAQRNRETLVTSATATLHREGPRVPMATIAADAGVGIGTLYRHFPTRAALLEYLTFRSFLRVLEAAQAAEHDGETALDALRLFIRSAIGRRNELVLPLHGGPAPTSPETLATQREVHAVVGRIIERGRAEGAIRRAVSPRDIVTFGSMLAQPRPPDPAWDATCLDLLDTFLAGLGAGAGAGPGGGAG